MEENKNKIAILMDFDNWFPTILKEDDLDRLQQLLCDVMNIVIENMNDVDYISIGLYGGWYSEKILTPKASTLLTMIPRLKKIFPYRLKYNAPLIKGDINLATQLYDDETVWYNSYREHIGLPKLRIKDDKLSSTCESNKMGCPIHILKKFTKNKGTTCHISSCETKHGEVFYMREQKYVDSMLVCDILSYGIDPDYKEICIMGEDCDIFPAFAALRRLNAIMQKSTRIEVFVRNEQLKQEYQSTLKQFGAKMNQIQFDI